MNFEKILSQNIFFCEFSKAIPLFKRKKIARIYISCIRTYLRIENESNVFENDVNTEYSILLKRFGRKLLRKKYFIENFQYSHTNCREFWKFQNFEKFWKFSKIFENFRKNFLTRKIKNSNWILLKFSISIRNFENMVVWFEFRKNLKIFVWRIRKKFSKWIQKILKHILVSQLDFCKWIELWNLPELKEFCMKIQKLFWNNFEKETHLTYLRKVVWNWKYKNDDKRSANFKNLWFFNYA